MKQRYAECAGMIRALLFAFTLVVLTGTTASSAVFTVFNTNTGGTSSLDSAINKANQTAGRDTIKFNLTPSAQVYVFYRSTPLPCLTDDAGVVIEGFTQTAAAKNTNGAGLGLNAAPKIMIYNNASVSEGLCINSDNNIIEGLIISNFGSATFNSGDVGISIGKDSVCTNNVIKGCFIGVDSTGKNGSSYQDVGVYIYGSSNNNFIGDGTAGGANLISGNGDVGIWLMSSGNGIRGNFIGIDIDGTASILSGTQMAGVRIMAINNTVGGNSSGDRNIISCNDSAGIESQADSTYIFGNYIGLTTSGSASGGDQNVGIRLARNYCKIGGSGTGEGNVISGNSYAGIVLSTNGPAVTISNKIRGNIIGLDYTKTSGVSNGSYGIFINGASTAYDLKDNMIGGDLAGEANEIAYSDTGIFILGGGNSYTINNRIRRNSIHSNTYKGIALSNNGNMGKTSPTVYESFICAGTGTIKGGASPYDTVDIYMYMGNQAKIFLDTAIANTSGFWEKSGLSLNLGDSITAIATNLNSSEISGAKVVMGDYNWTFNTGNVTCAGTSTGSATVTPTGGQTPYTYLWSPSGATFSNVTGLFSGMHTVTISDNHNCTHIDSVFVSSPGLMTITKPYTNVSCAGGSDGSATANPTLGTSPYTYLWSNTQTSQSIAGLTTGTYIVTVTDNYGCSLTDTIIISEPTGLGGSETHMNISCNGGNDGSIDITPTGGTPPYLYNWSNSANTEDIAGLTAGTYTVTVSDNNGCTTTATIMLGEPTVISHSTTITDVSCNGLNDGSIDLYVSGGISPYTYNWSNSEVSEDLFSQSADNYTVTITDNVGCTVSNTATISEPAILSASTSQVNISCFGNSDGSIDLTVSGGTVPYTYNWSNSFTSEDINSLNAGTYSVTVTDNNGCNTGDTVVITAPTGLTVPVNNVTHVACTGDATGSAEAAPTGGTSPYTYLWSDSQTTAVATGLTAGSYTATVTDNNGCTAYSAMITITEPGSALSTTMSKTDVTCSGGTTGSATVTPSGGTSPYTFLWNNTQTTAVATGLSQATYTVTVTDNNGCSATDVIGVIEPTVLTIPTTQTNVLCNAGNDGSATVTASGSTSPYTYYWTTSPVQSTAVATGLTSGSYTITVTDLNGCTNSSIVTISEPVVLSASTSTTNASCFNGSDGSATANSSGGISPYTFLWSNAQTTQIAAGLTVGSYTVTITDLNGCTTTAAATINEPAGLNITDSKTDVSCNGANDGSATGAVSGGTSPYTYLWSNTQTANPATGLSPGTYTLTVTDLSGCTAVSAIITISGPSSLTASTTLSNVNCSGGTTGSATVTGLGGTSPYTYLWNTTPSQSTQNATGLSAATYTATVTDLNGCTATATAMITAPAALAVTIPQTNITCNGANNGSATANATGGVSPYTYSWSTTPTQTTMTATGLSAAFFAVTVTDNNGCTATNGVTISEPGVLYTSVTKTDVACGSGSNGTATASPTGGTAPYTYNWNTTPVQTTATATGISAGTYTVSVTDNKGCLTSSSVTITEPALLNVTCSKTDVSCFGGNNGTATGTVTGGSAPYTFTWSNAQTINPVTGLTAGSYTLTVTDANGCTAVSTPLSVIQPSAALLTNTTVTDASCNGSTTGSATAATSGGTGPYMYSWNTTPVQTSTAATGLSVGTYTVTTTDNNGCTHTASAVIAEPAALIPNPSSSNPSCNGAANGTAAVAPTGGTSPYTFLWSPSGSTASMETGLIAGNYTVTVTDSKGCTATSPFTLTQPSALTVTTSKTNATTYGGSDGTATASPAGGTSGYAYSWSTTPTQNNPAATGLTAGVYTVQITDAASCTVTGTVIVGQPLAHNISGRVFRTNYADTVKSGYVYLIQYNTSNTSMQFKDTSAIGADGSYQFVLAQDDDYILLTDADTTQYPYSQRTYFGDSLYWDQAKLLTLNADTTNINMSIVEIFPVTGPGKVSGVVLQGNGSKKRMGPGSPIKGVKLSLNSKTTSAPIKFTESGDSGKFEFDNIPVGDYFLYADTTGIPVDLSLPTTTISIDSTDTSFKNVIIYVDSNKVYTSDSLITTIPYRIYGKELEITGLYPNPASHYLYLEVNNPTRGDKYVGIRLTDMKGTVIRNEVLYTALKGKNVIVVDVATLPNGIYLVQISDDVDILLHKRVVIVR